MHTLLDKIGTDGNTILGKDDSSTFWIAATTTTTTTATTTTGNTAEKHYHREALCPKHLLEVFDSGYEHHDENEYIVSTSGVFGPPGGSGSRNSSNDQSSIPWEFSGREHATTSSSSTIVSSEDTVVCGGGGGGGGDQWKLDSRDDSGTYLLMDYSSGTYMGVYL